MATDKTLVSRIPHEEISSFKSWNLPSLGNNGRVVPSVKRDDKTAASRKPAGKEVIEDAPEIPAKQLTADQLQKLTETAEKEAHEEGYAKGYEDGIKSGEKKGAELGEQKAYRETQNLLTEKINTFESIAEVLFQPATNHDALLENSILDMAVQLAQHLLNTELTSNPQVLFPIIEQAVGSLPAGAKNISVLLNPEDLPHIQEAFTSKTAVWNFVADPMQSRGGCKVESDVSALNYTVSQRIEDWKVACRDITEAQLAEIHSPENFKPELLPNFELDHSGNQSASQHDAPASSPAATAEPSLPDSSATQLETGGEVNIASAPTVESLETQTKEAEQAPLVQEKTNFTLGDLSAPEADSASPDLLKEAVTPREKPSNDSATPE